MVLKTQCSPSSRLGGSRRVIIRWVAVAWCIACNTQHHPVFRLKAHSSIDIEVVHDNMKPCRLRGVRLGEESRRLVFWIFLAVHWFNHDLRFYS